MSKRASLEVDSSSSPAENLHKWEHARQRDIDWDKKDLLEVIYWIRQWLGIVIGLVFGLLPITGIAGHLLFGALSAGIMFVYYTRFLNVDDEDEKYGRWDLLAEGMWTSYALFLITWISIYSLPY